MAPSSSPRGRRRLSGRRWVPSRAAASPTRRSAHRRTGSAATAADRSSCHQCEHPGNETKRARVFSASRARARPRHTDPARGSRGLMPLDRGAGRSLPRIPWGEERWDEGAAFSLDVVACATPQLEAQRAFERDPILNVEAVDRDLTRESGPRRARPRVVRVREQPRGRPGVAEVLGAGAEDAGECLAVCVSVIGASPTGPCVVILCYGTAGGRASRVRGRGRAKP